MPKPYTLKNLDPQTPTLGYYLLEVDNTETKAALETLATYSSDLQEYFKKDIEIARQDVNPYPIVCRTLDRKKKSEVVVSFAAPQAGQPKVLTFKVITAFA